MDRETVVSAEVSGFHLARPESHRESEILAILSTKDLDGPLSNFQLTVRVKSSSRGNESAGNVLDE